MSKIEIKNKDNINLAISKYESLKNIIDSCQNYTNTSYITGELSSYYSKLGDNTKEELKSLVTNFNNTISIARYSLDLYDRTDETLLKQLELLINELFTHVNDNNFNAERYMKDKNITEIFVDIIIEKIGITDFDEIVNLKEEIEKFIEEDYKNIETLNNWLKKIPDNFSDFNNNYKWDKSPNFTISYENGKSSCEWFNINGLKVRVTNITDVSSFPMLMELMNKTYCCDLVNEMNEWPKDYINLLGKRDYVDVVISSFKSSAGAAYYQSGNPYNDYIYLPTFLGNNMLYSSDHTYNYLKNTLVHEMSHYLDAIVGVTQIGEFDYENADAKDKEFYEFVINLMNNYMYGCQCINQHSDTVYGFDNYKIDENNNFCEGFAEFLRASLVDNDAFKKLIGIDNYNKLFGTMQNMNRKSEDGYEYYPVISKENNSITVMRVKNGVEEVYKSSEVQYDVNGRIYEEETQYDENGKLTSSTIVYEDGTKTERSYYENGQEKSYYEEYPNGTKYYYESYENGRKKSYREVNSNGREFNREYYENGQVKSSHEVNPNGKMYHYEYDENGTLTSSTTVYEDGTKINRSYYENGQEKTDVITHPDGSISSINYDENGEKIEI